MADVSFDGANKIIQVTLAPVDGANSIDVKIGLYSDWKEWMLLTDNTKYEQAMRGVGGDPLPGSKALGDTYFLLNGWKIRPYEASHTMTVEGNLYCEDGTSPYVSTVGTFNVMVISAVSQLVSATVQQLPEIEYASYGGGVTIDAIGGTVGTAYPIGTAASPVDNLLDAQTIAAARGFSKLFIVGNLTIGAAEDISSYAVEGEDKDSSTLTLTAGALSIAANLHNLTLTGRCGGRMNIHHCNLVNVEHLCATGGDANITDCKLAGTIDLNQPANQNYNFTNCIGKSGFILDVNGTSAGIHFTDFAGIITLQNITSATQSIQMDIDSALITLEPSCTDGTITLRGIGVPVDNSAGTVVNIDGLVILSDVQYASFAGGATIDAVNGNDANRGNEQYPVQTLPVALGIAVAKGFDTIFVKGNLTIGATDIISGYTLIGQGASFNVAKTTITLTDGCTTANTFFSACKVVGRQNGESIFDDCVIGELTNSHCQFKNCGMLGPVTVTNSGWTANHVTDLLNCHTSHDWYVLDYNASPLQQVYSKMSGRVKITNCTNALANIIIEMSGGEVWLDSSCTAGSITIRGMGNLIDESAGATVENDILDGCHLQDLHDEAFGKWTINPTTKKLTMYKADGVTVLKEFNLTDTTESIPAYIARVPV